MTANRYQEKAEVEVYASTLLDKLNAEGGIDAVMEARAQMEQIVAYNRGHKELTNAVTDPVYTLEQRLGIVKGVFKDVGPAMLGMLGVMVERGALDRLPRVLESFNGLIRDKLGVTLVDVTTRVPLDDHLRELIKGKASAELGGNVVLSEKIDEGMLGGIIMSVGDRRIDASMNTMLEGARLALAKSN